MRDPKEERAWEEFYQMYWAVIVRYAQKLGLDETSAHDVLQETMVVLLRQMPTFHYDPKKGKFRNFLLTIVHRKTLAALRRAGGRGEESLDATVGDDGLSYADKLADELATLPGKASEESWRASIQDEALRRVREDPSVAGRTWQVFNAYVLKRQEVGEVAKQFGIKENAVYQIKNRIIRRLRREVEKLTTELGE
ncbi:MAG: sigma-70 family RNA polymerase sigma factor [Verrucomicrobiia bacterium]|jgi:RNA polymerase sigma-70 factor (ECF subfamily)